MDLIALGWEAYKKQFPETANFAEDEIGRVAIENKTGYTLFTKFGELDGIVPRAVRFKSEDSAALPKVGDWVRFAKLPNEAKGSITLVLPRKSKLSRIGLGKNLEEQIIAANVDKVFIVQGLDENFSLARFERFLIMAKDGGAEPVIVLNKIDLVDNTDTYITGIKKLAPHVPVVSMSATAKIGIEQIQTHIEPGNTLVFVGVSGVGKSTIINSLLANDKLATGHVREIDSRGRHTTTRREMILLPGGGILIDTPGIRELQLEAGHEVVNDIFADIAVLANKCKFRDCDHEKSKGCAILEAVDSGSIPEDRYRRFIKIKREQEHQERKLSLQGQREHKAKNKQLQKSLRKKLKYKRG